MANITIKEDQWFAATSASAGSLPVVHLLDGEWRFGGLRRMGQVYTRGDGSTKAQYSFHGATANSVVIQHTFECGGKSATVDCVEFYGPIPRNHRLPFPLSEDETRARVEWRAAQREFLLFTIFHQEWRAKLGWDKSGARGSLAALRRAVKVLQQCKGDWKEARTELALLVEIPSSAPGIEAERLEAERLEAERVAREASSHERQEAKKKREAEIEWMVSQFGMDRAEAKQALEG